VLVRVSVLFLLLAACNKGGDSNPGDTDATDTDDTDVPVDPTVCPAYTGFDAAGRTWSFTSTQAFVDATGITSTWTVVTSSITPAGDGLSSAVHTHTEGTSDVPNTDSASFSTDVDLRCDIDGLWALNTRFDYTYTVFGIDTDGHSYTSYSAPDLIWARGAGVGTTWHSDPNGTIDSSEDGTSAFSQSIDREVTAAGSTTVPAGTYDTLTLVTTVTDDSGTVVATTYNDEVLGAVLSDVAQLTGSAAP
jgi:hypothetical protein